MEQLLQISPPTHPRHWTHTMRSPHAYMQSWRNVEESHRIDRSKTNIFTIRFFATSQNCITIRSLIKQKLHRASNKINEIASSRINNITDPEESGFPVVHPHHSSSQDLLQTHPTFFLIIQRTSSNSSKVGHSVPVLPSSDTMIERDVLYLPSLLCMPLLLPLQSMRLHFIGANGPSEQLVQASTREAWINI